MLYESVELSFILKLTPSSGVGENAECPAPQLYNVVFEVLSLCGKEDSSTSSVPAAYTLVGASKDSMLICGSTIVSTIVKARVSATFDFILLNILFIIFPLISLPPLT